MDRDERQRIIQEFAGKHFSLTDKPVPGRANTPEDKQQILNRILLVWGRNPKMRLGQLLGNVYHSTDAGGVKQYYTEDFELIENLEGFYEAD
jgi:hypothetical protein